MDVVTLALAKKYTNKRISESGGGNNSVYEVITQNQETDEQAIDRVVNGTELHKGDIAIVKHLIYMNKYEYTAYIYDDVWKAMQGNYNATSVYFDSDLLTTSAVGNVTLTNGQATIDVKGKNLLEAWETIFVKEDTDISVIKPNASITSPSAQYLEIGKSGSASITINYEDGKYEYGYTTEENNEEGHQATSVVNNGTTGATAKKYNANYNGQALVGEGNKFNVTSGTKTTNATMSISGSVEYNQGYIPVSNLKKMYASKRIKAGTTSASAKTLFYWYIPMYASFNLDGTIVDPSKITSEEVKSLTKITGATAYNKQVPTSATASGDWKQYFIAVPSAYGKKKPSVNDSNGLPLTVDKANDVTIDYAGTQITYNVFYISLASAYKTHNIKINW